IAPDRVQPNPARTRGWHPRTTSKMWLRLMGIREACARTYSISCFQRSQYLRLSPAWPWQRNPLLFQTCNYVPRPGYTRRADVRDGENFRTVSIHVPSISIPDETERPTRADPCVREPS